MRVTRKTLLRLTIGLAAALGLAAIGLVVGWVWVVPMVIRAQVAKSYGGHVAVGPISVGPGGIGVGAVALHEGPGAGSPVWARAAGIQTDLTVGGLLKGRFKPSVVTIRGPKITYRLDRDGKPLTKIPVKPSGKSEPLPTIKVVVAELTLAQEGRPSMVVENITGELKDGKLDAAADSTRWGHVGAVGRLTPTFDGGELTLSLPSTPVDPALLSSIPFVPEETWRQVQPWGPVGAKVAMGWGKGEFQVTTDVELKGTTVDLRSLQVTVAGATGLVHVEGPKVTLKALLGEAMRGRLGVDGTLDFGLKPPQIDLELRLDGVDVAATPKAWQIDEAGITGKLVGRARLKIALSDGGPDLTGTTGSAEVLGATIQGIPAKSLRLDLSAEGPTPRYQTSPSAWRGLAALGLVALQDPAPAPPEPEPRKGLVLPKSVTTDVEFADVDVSTVLKRVEALGVKVPVAVLGRLSLKARATIPLGTLKDVKGYGFNGQATLAGASIDGVGLGRLASTVRLADGVLELTDLRGRLGELSPTAEPTPESGPLPPGGFRGNLRAEVAPAGPLHAEFRGDGLPVGSLVGRYLPPGSPAILGLVDMQVRADTDARRLGEPGAWTVGGTLKSAHLGYGEVALDALSSRFAVENERLELPDLAASLKGKPLRAKLGLGLLPPFTFDASTDLDRWDLAEGLALVPGGTAAPVSGRLTAAAGVKGTLKPLRWETAGTGHIDDFRAEKVPLGTVPFGWETKGERIILTVHDARPFGGRLRGIATLPTRAGQGLAATAELEDLDTAQLGKSLPGLNASLAGKAGGTARLSLPGKAGGGFGAPTGEVRLRAPGLTVNGIPAEGLDVVLSAKEGALAIDAYARGFGGTFKLVGRGPMVQGGQIVGSVEALRFDLSSLWGPLGVTGSAARIGGRGAIVANLAATYPGTDVRARGIAEVRDLRLGELRGLGNLKADVSFSPAGWWLESLSGDLFGGSARGSASGDFAVKGGPAPRRAFDLIVERADLPRALAMVPSLARHVQGAGRLKLVGRIEEGFHAEGEVDVGRGSLFGLGLSELRAPLAVDFAPADGKGTLQVRRWSARLAGGTLSGDAAFRFGLDRTFSGEVRLHDLDLSALVRRFASAQRPATGQVSGTISFGGPDPADPRRLKGQVVLDLNNASVGELPVFRQIDTFLGSARGGLFEDGDLRANFDRGRLVIEELTLAGRAVQVHAAGTVGFDGRLDLVVLVNTSQIIAESGQALLGIIPGLPTDGRPGTAAVGSFLSNRLLKFKVGGTIGSPSVNIDPGVAVSTAAVGFFGGILKLPLGLLR